MQFTSSAFPSMPNEQARSKTKSLNDHNKEHRMGTTIMAVAYPGGVVMGADSRTSTGSYVANRLSDKVVPVHEKIFCCRSGSAADTQAVAAMVKYHLSLHSVEIGQPRVHTAATLFRDIVYENKDRLSASIICGGFDDRDGGSVYSIPLGGSLIKGNYALGGSGSSYIQGLVAAEYRDNFTREECEKFVTKCIAHAMSVDGSSGGVVRLTNIDKNGVNRTMIPGNELPVM